MNVCMKKSGIVNAIHFVTKTLKVNPLNLDLTAFKLHFPLFTILKLNNYHFRMSNKTAMCAIKLNMTFFLIIQKFSRILALEFCVYFFPIKFLTGRHPL